VSTQVQEPAAATGATSTTRELGSPPAPRTRLADVLVLLVPGALVAYLGFRSGGTFPGATGLGAVLALLALFVRVATASRPFAGLGPVVAVGGGALALFAAWTWASRGWSDADARALLETNRAVLYLAVLLLTATVAWSADAMRWLLRGLLVGCGALLVAGLVARMLPDVFAVELGTRPERLTWPLSYWNAMGVMAAMTCVLALHHVCDEREAWWGRLLGAALLPVCGAALILSFSRGALVAGAGLAVVYVVLARPRGTLSGLLAAAPFTALAMKAAYDAELLGSETPTSAAAAAQGHDLATTVLLCVLGAVAVRALLLALDARLGRVRVTDRTRRVVGRLVVGAAVVAVGAGGLAAASSGVFEEQWERFKFDDSLKVEDQRDRLTFLGDNGRLEFIDTALDAYVKDRVKGTGAGTWELEWERSRETTADRYDAHSLYFEVLGELGLVGAVLLGIALLTPVLLLLWRARSPARAVQVAALAFGLTWAAHATIDFDWEVAATTVPFFAIAGLAMARPAHERADEAVAPSPARRRSALALRVGVAVLVVAAAVMPARVAISSARLDDAREAFLDDRCAAAVGPARSSLDMIGSRPEPYEILGLCAAQAGRDEQAVRHLRAAVARDPRNWRFHYSLGLVQAAGGRDARRALRTARRLSPKEEAPQEALRRLEDRSARERRSVARRLPLPDD
jgi:O-antigen ligase